MKLKFRSKFNHDFISHDYLHSAVLKTLYNFKIKRAHNQFFFQNVHNNKIFKIFRMFKATVELTFLELTFTTQKANTFSPCTGCFVFNWKYLFWVNLVQKLKMISLSWNFVPRLIQICRISWWCSLFLFLTRNTFLDQFGPRNQNCQFELKYCTRLIWISRIM